MVAVNDTHDSKRRSWVESANTPGTEFPIQNLPLGVFQTAGGDPRGGVAIGNQILDFAASLEAGLFSDGAKQAAREATGPTLNALMALGNDAASALRAAVSDILTQGSKSQSKAERCLVPMAEASMGLPAHIGSFTDFLCSRDHTMRMSPDGKLPPAFTSLPIAYHSRATTVRVSGTPLIRPNGQFQGTNGEVVFGPEPRLDYELELGAWIVRGNDFGRPIPIEEAADHVFGYCLLNDWSARGIQFWESRPLGPFLGKSMMTTVSPWIVMAEAMAPFQVAPPARESNEQAPAFLNSYADQREGSMDIRLQAEWSTAETRTDGTPPTVVTRTNFRHCFWTFAQMVAHHASNGCNLEPGDLLGSGTTSGPTDESRACIAELNGKGSTPIDIGGEPRMWLEDGDEINFRGRAEQEGFATIGFGECRGIVAPAGQI